LSRSVPELHRLRRQASKLGVYQVLRANPNLRRKARQVRLLVLDVDGVLTDGRIVLDDQHQEWKSFHTRDGLGLRLLLASGVQVALLSARQSASVKRRAQELGIPHLLQGHERKLPALEELTEKLKLDWPAVACMGDDLPDLPLMLRAGLGLTVADAHPLLLQNANWHSSLKGGRGAAREACDLIMAAQGTLPAALETHFK